MGHLVLQEPQGLLPDQLLRHSVAEHVEMDPRCVFPTPAVDRDLRPGAAVEQPAQKVVPHPPRLAEGMYLVLIVQRQGAVQAAGRKGLVDHPRVPLAADLIPVPLPLLLVLKPWPSRPQRVPRPVRHRVNLLLAYDTSKNSSFYLHFFTSKAKKSIDNNTLKYYN